MIVRWLKFMARVYNELYGTQTNRSYLNILEVIVITKITKNEQRKRATVLPIKEDLHLDASLRAEPFRSMARVNN